MLVVLLQHPHQIQRCVGALPCRLRLFAAAGGSVWKGLSPAVAAAQRQAVAAQISAFRLSPANQGSRRAWHKNHRQAQRQQLCSQTRFLQKGLDLRSLPGVRAPADLIGCISEMETPWRPRCLQDVGTMLGGSRCARYGYRSRAGGLPTAVCR